MTRLRAISIVWALVGAAVILWAVYGAVTLQSEFGFMAGAFTAAVMAIAFGLLALAGSILTFRQRRAGQNLLRAVSVLAILYAVVFFLFGREVRGPIYALVVGSLLLLAVASLVMLSTGASRGA
jgi:hypothetical protein